MNRSLGVGRLLIAIYGIFALSASARALFQIATKFDEAPLAYSLSALSALVYVFATFALARPGAAWRRRAMFAVWFELIGVISVGGLSIFLPELLDHPSIWSGFGAGYAFIPLLLPVLGLIWLRRQSA